MLTPIAIMFTKIRKFLNYRNCYLRVKNLIKMLANKEPNIAPTGITPEIIGKVLGL